MERQGRDGVWWASGVLGGGIKIKSGHEGWFHAMIMIEVGGDVMETTEDVKTRKVLIRDLDWLIYRMQRAATRSHRADSKEGMCLQGSQDMAIRRYRTPRAHLRCLLRSASKL